MNAQLAPSDEGAVTEGDWGRECAYVFSPSVKIFDFATSLIRGRCI